MKHSATMSKSKLLNRSGRTKNSHDFGRHWSTSTQPHKPVNIDNLRVLIVFQTSTNPLNNSSIFDQSLLCRNDRYLHPILPSENHQMLTRSRHKSCIFAVVSPCDHFRWVEREKSYKLVQSTASARFCALRNGQYRSI